MNYYVNVLLLCFAGLTLSGCSGVEFSKWHFPYMMEVEQGNYITSEQINALHVGMTKEQILYVLGSPLTQFMFDQKRWDFYYQDFKNNTLKRSYTLSIFFDNNQKVTNIVKSGQVFTK